MCAELKYLTKAQGPAKGPFQMKLSAFFQPTFNKSGLSLKKNKIKLPELNIGKRSAHFPSCRTVIFVSCDTCARQCKKVIPAFSSTYLEFNFALSLRRNLIITIWFLVYSITAPMQSDDP